jgi:uncharacterized protein (UPF0276 family)
MESLISSPAPRPVLADPLAAIPRLGVGLSFQAALKEFALEHLEEFDFVEVIPDTFWLDRGKGTADRYQETAEFVGFFGEMKERRPLVCHSIGLSIGSADHFDLEHVEQIARWHRRLNFPWHSDHLSYNRLDHATGPTIDLGVTLPVPYDDEVLELLIGRVRAVQERVAAPFLLENNVYYFEIPGQDMKEAEFLNRLTAATGCGLLLDLHNVFVNSTNHGFDPWDFLGELDLTRVVEVHLGGGSELDGVYLDSHSGPTPEPVWKLLEEIVPQAPNLCGVVFEVFGTYYPILGPERLRTELARMRRSLARL